MRILIIAPLPPPIGGHSIVSKTLTDGLGKIYDIDVVNLSKNSFKEGVDSVKRVVQVAKLLMEVKYKIKNTDVVYFTISESLAGNLKDLLIYFICRKTLSNTIIHLHGGSIKRLLWDTNQTIFLMNKYFIHRLGGVIISGKSHLTIFENLIDFNKLHIVPNFAFDFLFLSSTAIENKYLNIEPLKILYISNMIPKKGYAELAEAFSLLEEDCRRKIILNFAGAFESEREKKLFLEKIKKYEQIKYHGIVNDEVKKKLFGESHVFCLPTSYFEGQPISILEAYASGCVVLTTGQDGILDIFIDQENGFQIKSTKATELKNSLLRVLHVKSDLLKIALRNNNLAKKKYRQKTYIDSINAIIIALKNNSI